MMEELREPPVHFSICRAMAHGHGRPNEIAQAAGLTGTGNIASYLSSLRELRFVERRLPATVRNPERSRLGLYRLSSAFLVPFRAAKPFDFGSGRRGRPLEKKNPTSLGAARLGGFRGRLSRVSERAESQREASGLI